jgi:lambda repressor-like predicted transcriptional regulator
MNPFEIQYELKKRGITQASIARELEVSRNHVSAVIRTPDKRQSARVMRAVAAKIGQDPRLVFFSQYHKKDSCAA